MLHDQPADAPEAPGSALSAQDEPPSSSEAPGAQLSRRSSLSLDPAEPESAATCAILLPSKYPIKQGAELWGGVKLGKMLGAGVQAKVFELDYADGRPTGKVLKIAHTDLAHRMLNNPAIWIGMEREWEIGTQLRAALEEPGGKLPGFMRMCDCLVRSDDPASGKAAFNGMILEKLNGWEVYKRIDNPEFHNIHYVREMLYQVFSALDRAQRKLGFHHADLGMRNVMEHYPRLWEDVEQPQPHGSPAGGCSPCAQQQHAQQQLGAAGADGGAAAAATAAPEQRASCFIEWAEAGEGYQLPERRQQPWWRRKAEGPGASCGKVRCRPGFSCNADGSRMPLGPNLEFKVIDFGVAVFDERLAQAAGGYESEAVMERLNEVFAAKRITFGSQGSQKGRMLEMATSEGAIPGGHKRDWHLVPTGFRNRWRVKTTPPGAKPIVSAHSLEAEGLPPPPVQAQRVPPQPAAQPPASPFAAAAADDDGATELPQRFRSATLLRRPGQGLEQASAAMRAGEAAEAAVLRASQSAGSEAGSGSVHSNPQHASSRPLTYRQSPIEQMYRRFWQRKGDVFHLLLGMALVLDDRVWPKEDERDVQLFISLVHHVTGVRMRASFAVEGQGNQPGIFGRLVCGSASRVKEERGAAEKKAAALREYGRWGKTGHWFRRMHIRMRAHLKPFNSGLLAGEALVAPFFGAGRVQHAKLPVCVDQAFPRSASLERRR